MTSLKEIEGIGEIYAAKIKDHSDVDTVEELLTACKTPAGRKELAEQTGISEKLILEWANMADLFRITGVGEEYADLLEESGVDTVPELAQRNAANLAAKLAEVNAAKQLVRQVPSESMVEKWIAEAKELPRVLEY
jgi:predicted flap endonuclease-1-like 5' DNA nuclease